MFEFISYMMRFINLFLIFKLIFHKKKDPILVVAWSVFLIVLPIISFIFYLLVERTPKLPETYRELNKFEKQRIGINVQDDQVTKKNLIEPEVFSLIKFNQKLNHSLLTKNNKVQFYNNAHDKYKQLFIDIENAQHSIHIVYFIIRPDESGKKFIELLAKKAHKGLEVRLVYDSGGCFPTPKSFFNILKENGGKVYGFHPPKLLFSWLNYNYRNHRKIVVIDGRISYLGGMNIGDEYLSLNHKFHPWRDAHLRITGEAARDLQLRFFRDYFMASNNKKEISEIMNKLTDYFPALEEGGDTLLQIVSDGPDTDTDDIKAVFIKMIYSAKSSIIIQTPYFIPDSSFLDALRSAAYSGVSIKVMIPTIADNHFVYRTTTSFIKLLTDVKIDVYLYKGFLHSKIIAIDNKMCTIGSTNIDIRSFKINYEINALIYNKDFTKRIYDQFADDLKNCVLVDEMYFYHKSKLVVVEESIYRLLSSLM